MAVLSVPTWPNCFSQNFCWIKLEIRLSACFSILMNSRQFVECGSFQNRGVEWLQPASICLSQVRVSWHNRVVPLLLNQAVCLWWRGIDCEREGWASVCQTKRAYRKVLTSSYQELPPILLFNPLRPKYLSSFFFFCMLTSRVKALMLFGKESVLINWLRVLTGLIRLKFWV